MEETELQSLVELNKQFEEFRLNLLRQAEHRARHFEEQKLHGQNMEKQMMEMKEILISMAAHQVFDETSKPANTIEVVQIDESSEDGGEALFEVVNRIERDEDPPQILEKKEPNFVKESSDSTAHQVLDKMPSDLNHDLAVHQVLDETPKFTDEVDLEIARVSTTEERHDLEVFGVSNLNEAKPLLMAKNVFADLINMMRKEPAQEGIRTGHIGLLCFDPGGRDLLVTGSLKFELPLREKCGLWCIDELLPDMTNAFQIYLFGIPVHNPFNLESDQGKENIGLQNFVLETDMFGSVACFETFCFDPGGNSAGVLLERHIVEYELSKFVAWKLVEMEPENSAPYVVLSNLYADMGRWADVSKVRGLMEEKALMKAFEVYAGKSLLQLEHILSLPRILHPRLAREMRC